MQSAEAIPLWQQRFAGWVGRAVVLASIWSFVAIPLHLIRDDWVVHVDRVFEVFGIPAGHTVFPAVYLAVVGSALLRGKRAALLWVLVVFEVVWLLAGLGIVVIDSSTLRRPATRT